MMHKILITFLAFLMVISGFWLISFVSTAYAVDFNQGTYINLCGTGTSATANSCNQGCDMTQGKCTSANKVVVKFTCSGRVTDCRQDESTFSNSQAIGSVACGQTVQIDVFSKNCRANGQWDCNDQDLKDYIVWYSGDCQANTPKTNIVTRFIPYLKTKSSPTPTPSPSPSPTPTATPTPDKPQLSKCEDLSVVGGNDSLIPAKVTLRARGSDNRGSIQQYKFYFGDGKQQESSDPEIQHTYESSGSFLSRVDIKDSQGNWKTSDSCEAWVRVKSSPVESRKSGCSDIKITASNNGQAPSEVEFKVSGFDNKGDLQHYRLVLNGGPILESSDPIFRHTYTTAGTYPVSAYIRDSQGQWFGGENGCNRTVYIKTEDLTHQPATGTPTLFSVVGLTSGMTGVGIHILKKKLQA